MESAVNRELTLDDVGHQGLLIIKGNSRTWRISGSSSPPTPEANRTSASSAPRPDTPVEGEGMEVSEREEICGKDMQRQRDHLARRKEAIFISHTNLGGPFSTKIGSFVRILRLSRPKPIFGLKK